MVWTLDIQDYGGTPVASDVDFAAARLSWAVDGPGAVEVDLRASDIADLWTAGTGRVVANLDASPMAAAYLTRLTQDGPPGNITYKASGLGLASILDYRIVRHAFTIADEAAVMVEALLDEAQAQWNGDMGFTMGSVTGTTATRTRVFCFGVVIADAIRELAGIGHGFDWEIDATGALNIWQSSRGTDTGLTLAIEDTQEWSVESETSDLATIVSAVGDTSQPFGPIHNMVRSELVSTLGRREVVIDVDSTDAAELIDSASAELETRGGARLRVRTMWLDDRGPWALGDVWLQDRVSVDVPDFLGGIQDMRCTEISVSLDPGTIGFLEHTFEALVTDVTEGDPDEESS